MMFEIVIGAIPIIDYESVSIEVSFLVIFETDFFYKLIY